MLACTRNNLNIIQLLIKNNADVNQVNKDGWNCFQIAVREGHQDIIEYFLSINMEFAFKFKTKNGRTPLHTAALHGHLRIVKLLLEKSDKLDSKMSDKMLNEKDSCGITPFMDALLADHVEIVEYLIQNYKVVFKFFIPLLNFS
jgi:ankyrin repeat protein